MLQQKKSNSKITKKRRIKRKQKQQSTWSNEQPIKIRKPTKGLQQRPMTSDTEGNEHKTWLQKTKAGIIIPNEKNSLSI